MSILSTTVSLAQARRLWLRAQRLDTGAPFGSGAAATPAAIAHLGYVQIDTIHVIERCHHHILFNRIPDYRREHLHQAQSVDRVVFEYWAHALAYLPLDALPYYVGDMRRYAQQRKPWHRRVRDEDVRRLLTRIRRHGPLTMRDIDDEVLVAKEHEWASRKPSKAALELLFYTGQLTISQRSGMLKSYELLTRHFGWRRRPAAARDNAVLNYLLDRALRSQGVISVESTCYLDAPRKPAMRALIERRVRRGELVRVSLPQAPKWQHWAHPQALAQLSQPRSEELTHVLSPFDPLIIQRQRLQLFFEYLHRFEAYVPKHKRLFGYFACPVLVGDAIVAAIDLKADRAVGRLLVQQWTWTGKQRGRALRRLIEEALHRFERFQLAKHSQQ